MALAMKDQCESCSTALAPDLEAFICSYECTFCAGCAARLSGTCPNCRGELVARPVRSGVPRMQPTAVRHSAIVEWLSDGSAFVDQRYSRAHSWRFDGGLQVAASASPHVVRPPLSDPAGVDPEEGFVASLASCHMLWFLSLAAERGYVVERYADHAFASTLGSSDGRKVLAHVVLRPGVMFSSATPCASTALAALHHEAHRQCFLAGALRYPLVIEPRL